MKLKSLLSGLALVAAIATTACAVSGNPSSSATPVAENGNGTVPVTLSVSENLSLLNVSHTGRTLSTDFSDAYVVESVPGDEKDNSLEFWEISEFETWMEQQRAEYQILVDSSDKSFYDKAANGDYFCREWTQQDLDALYAVWQEQLDLMKQGYRFTKPIINSEDGSLVGVFEPETSPVTAAGSTIVTIPDGSTVNLGHFDTAKEAKKAVEEYLRQQVVKGVLTQQEANTILANGAVE